MAELVLLLVGDTTRPEFRQAEAPLKTFGRVARAPDVGAAVALLEEQQLSPDVIVVAQAFAGQFASEAIDRLRWLAPLARGVALLGTWCEGEMRSGRPWPAAVRVYWHQWSARCARELGRLAAGQICPWGLPATASEEERCLSNADEPEPPRTGRIAVHTPWFDMQDWLGRACRRRGYATLWFRPDAPIEVSGVRAAIFDALALETGELRRLAHLAVAIQPAPGIALMDFPRADDVDRALDAGAAAVLSKPLWLDDLFWELDRLGQVASSEARNPPP